MDGGRVFCLLTALFPDLFALDPHACNIGGNGMHNDSNMHCLLTLNFLFVISNNLTLSELLKFTTTFFLENHSLSATHLFSCIVR